MKRTKFSKLNHKAMFVVNVLYARLSQKKCPKRLETMDNPSKDG